MGKMIYLGLAYCFLALGFLGALLPLLPTTPFLLLAVWFGAKGSSRFKWWLLRHPKLGPDLRLWYRKGAINTKAKATAIVVMMLSWSWLWFKGSSNTVLLITALVLCSSATFILTRPSGENKNA